MSAATPSFSGPEPPVLSRVRVVLVAPSHPGNIGAAARAMKTMGLRRLYLVAPEQFPSAGATARASGADDVLAAAQVCATLEEAVAACGCVLATSARTRTLRWSELTPRAGAERLIRYAQTADVALVFGTERSGLSNAHLDRCQAVVRVPADPDYASLNLAAAVQILAYETRLAALAGAAPVPAGDSQGEPASHAELEGFYGQLERVLIALEFLDPDNPRLLLRRLRRLYGRAVPSKVELNILRGILTAIERRRSG